jgi:hypothetical protein
MRTESEARTFDQALLDLAELPREQILENLDQIILAFDDATKHLEVMWNLVHLIEAFDLEVTLPKIDEVAPTLLERAHDWASLILSRIMYTGDAWDQFKEIFPTLELKNRAAICSLLKAIAADDESDSVKEIEVSNLCNARH